MLWLGSLLWCSSISGPETSACHRHSKERKKERKKQQALRYKHDEAAEDGVRSAFFYVPQRSHNQCVPDGTIRNILVLVKLKGNQLDKIL